MWFKKDKIKDFLKKCVLIFIGVILALGFFEIMARVTGLIKNTGELKIPVSYVASDSESDFDITKNFPPTSSGFIDGKEMLVSSNNLGCFDSDYNGEKNTVLLVGDSFTWGYVPLSSNWGSVLENQIGQRVLKCGVFKYGTKQELMKAKKVISETKEVPKLIIVGYYYNDVVDDLMFPNSIDIVDGNLLEKKTISGVTKNKIQIDEFTNEDLENQLVNFQKYCTPSPSARVRISCFIKKHSLAIPFIYEKAKAVATEILGLKLSSKLFGTRSITAEQDSFTRNLLFIPDNAGYDWIKYAKEKNFRNILEFKKFADSKNTKILFVLFPSMEMVYSPFETLVKADAPEINFTEGNNLLKNFMDKNKIDFLDLWPGIKQYADTTKSVLTKDDLYSGSNKHLNIKGNTLAGMLISKFLFEKNYAGLSLEERSGKEKEIDAFLNSF